ncbi:low molecular weight protein-tyrosine-phosphatase [Nocardioides sp.]|uniref:low molecular weight protein-tyrosine-phosphatase n=1 Tax=Nocardioides sp. TaxID=35761 RepID=UPI003D137852
MDLPTPRHPGTYRIAVVCLGNICRSPMAEVVLTAHLERAGLADAVVVDSSGTGGWHVGSPMDERAAGILGAQGYDASRHRAARFTSSRAMEHDLVLAMDATNEADLRRLGVEERLRRFRDFDPEGPGDVPDPYYGGHDGFADVLAMVERTSDALVTALKGLP